MPPAPPRSLVLLAAVAVAAAWPSPAFAYIDPNAGGALLQLLAPLLAAVAGGWLMLRRWIAGHVDRWRRRMREGRRDD
jgi:hypothetical protein